MRIGSSSTTTAGSKSSGYPFPHEAKEQFVATYKKMWTALYE